MTEFDSSGLAARLAVRIRISESPVEVHCSAVLRAMSAIDAIELEWQSDIARLTRLDRPEELGRAFEEMLHVDVLLRCWAAWVACCRVSGWHPLRQQNMASVLTRTLLQQRKRLLIRMMGSELPSESLQRVDRLRRTAERWNDVLLSVFPAMSSSRVLQFDHERMRDYAELWPSAEVCATRAMEPVVVTALKSSLPPIPIGDPARASALHELERVVEAVTLSGERQAGVDRSLKS